MGHVPTVFNPLDSAASGLVILGSLKIFSKSKKAFYRITQIKLNEVTLCADRDHGIAYLLIEYDDSGHYLS